MEGVSLEIRTLVSEILGFKLGLRVGTEPIEVSMIRQLNIF